MDESDNKINNYKSKNKQFPCEQRSHTIPTQNHSINEEKSWKPTPIRTHPPGDNSLNKHKYSQLNSLNQSQALTTDLDTPSISNPYHPDYCESTPSTNPYLSLGRKPMSPLTIEILKEVNPKARKRLIGEKLFSKIHVFEPRLAGKITDILLEMDNFELLQLLSEQKDLMKKINEAVVVLKQEQIKKHDDTNNTYEYRITFTKSPYLMQLERTLDKGCMVIRDRNASNQQIILGSRVVKVNHTHIGSITSIDAFKQKIAAQKLPLVIEFTVEYKYGILCDSPYVSIAMLSRFIKHLPAESKKAVWKQHKTKNYIEILDISSCLYSFLVLLIKSNNHSVELPSQLIIHQWSPIIDTIKQKLKPLNAPGINFHDFDHKLHRWILKPQSFIYTHSTKCHKLKTVEINCTSIDQCPFTDRILKCLYNCENLNIMKSKYDENRFVEYCNEKCKWLLDDYIHILETHNNEEDLNKIFSSMINKYGLVKCNVRNCSVFVRQNRNRINDEQKTEQKEHLGFYRDIIDQIHCYLYHLYDTGLRRKMGDNKLVAGNSNNDKSLIDIVARSQNNKFVLNNSNEQENGTFLNGLISFMTNEIDTIQIENFKNLQHGEEYDTDAIVADISEGESNIQAICDERLRNLCGQYWYWNKLHIHTFDIGLRFYYWKWFKIKRNIKKYEKLHSHGGSNINEHGGYAISALFVELKYLDVKDEILNNKIYSLNLYQFKTSLNKSSRYINTKKAKSVKASCEYEYDREDLFHYNIKKDSTISSQHLLSIILYCDWSDLCKEFSATFRKPKLYQSMLQMKRKNQEFANWSKLIRETVEIFGYNRWGESVDANIEIFRKELAVNRSWNKRNRLMGPFFCGVSYVMVLPEFDIRLNCPTSASKQIEVAERFAGKDGIIIQLNNSRSNPGNMLSGFACSWISNYAFEDEWLFCGGAFRMKIEDITIIQTNQNHKPFIQSLHYFDCMVNGTICDNWRHINDDDYDILNNLMKHKIKQRINQYPKYINDTFTAYTNHKTQISINLYCLNKYFGKRLFRKASLTGHKLPNLIIHSLSSTNVKSKSNNVLRQMLFRIFPKVNQINIETNHWRGDSTKQTFAVDLSELLRALAVSLPFIQYNLKIIIYAYQDTNKISWIKKKFSSIIKAGFKKKNFNIDISTEYQNTKDPKDALVITNILQN